MTPEEIYNEAVKRIDVGDDRGALQLLRTIPSETPWSGLAEDFIKSILARNPELKTDSGTGPSTTPTIVSAADQYVDPLFGEEGRTPVPVRPETPLVVGTPGAVPADSEYIDFIWPESDKDPRELLTAMGQYQKKIGERLGGIDLQGRPAFGTPAMRLIESGMLAGMPEQHTRYLLSGTKSPFFEYIDEVGIQRSTNKPLPERWGETINISRQFKKLHGGDPVSVGEFIATTSENVLALMGEVNSDKDGFTNTLTQAQKWAARAALGGASSGLLGQINSDRFNSLLRAWKNLQVYKPGQYSSTDFLPWVVSILPKGSPGYMDGFSGTTYKYGDPKERETTANAAKVAVEVVATEGPGSNLNPDGTPKETEVTGIDNAGQLTKKIIDKGPPTTPKTFVEYGTEGGEDLVMQPSTTPTTVPTFNQYVDPEILSEKMPLSGEEGRTPVPVRQRGEISTGFVPQDMAWTGGGRYTGFSGPPPGPIQPQPPINPVTGLPLTQSEAQANIQDMRARLAAQERASAFVPQDMAWTGEILPGQTYFRKPGLPLTQAYGPQRGAFDAALGGQPRRVESLYPEVGQYVPGVTPEPMPMRTGGGPYGMFDTDITAYTEPASRFIKWLGQQPGNIPGYTGF